MKNLNRWVYAIAGVVILLFAGLVYAWSVLSGPIAAEFAQWTKAQLSLTFTLVMICFCIGCMIFFKVKPQIMQPMQKQIITRVKVRLS